MAREKEIEETFVFIYVRIFFLLLYVLFVYLLERSWWGIFLKRIRDYFKDNVKNVTVLLVWTLLSF